MAKVRCPLCSNLNPPEAEECSFCGARLKPLAQPSNDQPDANPPEDENDWLRSLQGDQNEQDETGAFSEEPLEPGANVPDWLSRIRDRAQTETGGDEEQPDWMQDLSAEDTAASANEEDWFSRLETPSEANSAEQPGMAEPASDLPDWLSDLSGAPESEPAEPSGSLDTPEEDFSFLRGEAGSETPEQAEQGAGFGLTGFLASIESESESDEEGQSSENVAAEGAAEEALPDWLSTSDSETGEETEESGAQAPEWSGSLASEETPVSEEPLGAAPDWLSELGAERQPAETPAEDLMAQTGELPSWLIDDEMAALPAARDEEEPSGGEEAESAASAEIPDWMAEFQAPALEQPEPPDVPATTPLFSDDLPDFSAEADASSEPEPEAADEPGSGVEKAAVPEWLTDFEEQTPATASVPPLFETQGTVDASAAAEGDQPFDVDLPDWLSEDLQREPGQETPQAEEAADEVLAKAELPDWVKEMRPIETIIPVEAQIPESEPRAEKSGPLAGLTGILPVEEIASQYSRPPVYSAKLRVTEKQRGQAAQFETIIEQESQPLLIPTRGKRAQGGWLRVLIAMLFIFVLALPPLLDIAPLAVPTLSPDETKRMFDQIEGGLSSSAPVLLAVEFDPGLWGEMKLASQPVIDHIMSKNARIVVVSTRANGPAMAQQLLSEIVAGHDGYNLGEMTENLGYLPGDTISLLEFAHEPAFAAPANLAGELAWERTALQGITGLEDFASVVVLTDTAETGRAWVEQVQPEMGDVPLLMVTSAQAAPMMTPFIESGQVQGMVSGLLGGVLYAQWAQKEGAAFTYLASYQVGVLLALAMALGGGLISGAIALINRGKDED